MGNDKNKTMVLLVGKSGSGKTTIADKCERDYGLKSIVSYTTRPKRSPNETGHIFITSDEFSKLKDIVAYTKYNDYEYCATAQQVEESDIYIIDPKGVQYFKEHYKGNKNIVVVYIVASSNPHEAFGLYYERMKARGNTVEEAATRVALDEHEFGNFAEYADYVFVNRDLEDIDIIAVKIAKIIQEKGAR